MLKYPTKKYFDILKFLFHGTRKVPPNLIITSEYGFDFRYSSDNCLFGTGSYFANTSKYSHDYAHKLPSGKYQMFVALVVTGKSAKLSSSQKLKMPPMIAGT